MAEVGNVYESLTVCTASDQASVLVMHWLCNTKIGTGATDAQIATQLDAVFFPVMKPLISTLTTYRGVGVRKRFPLPLGSLSSTIANLAAGTGSASLLPRQVSGIITARTALAGKSYRGRLYIPFPGTGDLDGTILAKPIASYQTRLNALGAALLPGFTAGVGGNTNSFAPVIFSKKLSASTPITQFLGQLLWATQRRRGGFGRPNPPPF